MTAAEALAPATPWQPVARVGDVDAEPVGVRVLGGRWVLARLDGSLVAFVDRCPHRDVPLSTGWISCLEDTMVLSCAYHGWSFAADGACIDIPFMERAEIPDWLRLPGPAGLVQRYGLVWMAPREPSTDLPDIPEWNRAGVGFDDVRCVAIDVAAPADDDDPHARRATPARGRLTITTSNELDRALFGATTGAADTRRVVDYEHDGSTAFVLRVAPADGADVLVVSAFVQRESDTRLRCYVHGGRAPDATPRHVVHEVLIPSVLATLAPRRPRVDDGDPFGAALRDAYAALGADPS